MQEHVGNDFSDKDVSDYLWSTLKSGRVVPGYGHAVLRKPDPRFEALMDYASSRPEIAKDPVFRLVKKNSEIAPGVLKEHGKTKASSQSHRLSSSHPRPPHPPPPLTPSTPLQPSSTTMQLLLHHSN
jgi:hypothetical protein